MTDIKIGFIGCGKLGLPCAEVFSEIADVVCFDLIPHESPCVRFVDSISKLDDRDIIFIAVQTPHVQDYDGTKPVGDLPPKDFDYSSLIDVINDITNCISPKTMIVIISTVLPGTIRYYFSEFLNKYTLIYNPYLIAMGTVKEDMRDPEMIIVGTKDGDVSSSAVKLLETLYAKITKQTKARFIVGTYEEAESIKIFYNTFISTKIAIVNMIQDVAERIPHINVDVVTKALAESDRRIMSPAYMKAGMGDGGPCHPRDNIALRYLANKLSLPYDFFSMIVVAREYQAENMAKKLLLYGNNIIILGKAYKPNTCLTAGSYSLLVGHYVELHGGTISYYDPCTGDTVIPVANNTKPVYLLASQADWVASFPFEKGSFIVDPWRNYKSADNSITVIQYGNSR